MQNKGQYIWGLIGRFLPSFIFLGTTIVLARVLTPDDFGKIGVLTILFTIADALTDAGLGGSLIKEKTLNQKDSNTISTFNIVISAILYLILFCSSDYIERYFGIDDLSMITKLLSLTFVINSFALVPKSLLARDLKFKELSYVAIISTAISAVVSIATAFMGLGVYSLVIYRLLAALIAVVLSYFYSKYKLSFIFSLDSFKRIAPFGIYSSVSTVVDTIYENLLTSIFGKTMGATTAGYFYQAKKTEETLTTSLANTIGTVAFPILTKKKDDKQAFISESRSILFTISALIIPLILLCSAMSEFIIKVLYGDQWMASAPYFELLMFAGCFMILENLNRSFIKSLGQGRLLLTIAIVKRGIGILVLFSVAAIHSDFLVEAYIICSLLAYLINQIALSTYLRIGIAEDLILFVKVVLIGVAIYLLFIGSKVLCNNLLLEFIAYGAILIAYYLFVLPRLGVSLVKEFCIKVLKKINR